MYVDSTTTKRGDKVYVRHLLRTSYRENGKVKHKTLLNISHCPDEEIAAIKLALKHKKKLASLASLDDIETTLGKRIGAVWLLNTIAKRIGISKALGSDLQARLAVLQVIARTVDQGSRLSAVRFAQRHAVCEILGIQKLDEDDLYENLAWLARHQEQIEHKLFKARFPDATPTLFLYDVTSSYLEGDCNELGRYGYNRDRKKGKKQIVIGLLAGPDGLPVAVRVFQGNTGDTQTVAEQVRILAQSFGACEVTLVGDRGMIKGPQIEAFPESFHYITAIAKPQIRKMLSEGVLQYDLFDDSVCEVQDGPVRYILRRNPMRAVQLERSRASKLATVELMAQEQTTYLAEHPRAKADKALGRVAAKIERLKAGRWLTATEKGRVIEIEGNEAALKEEALLDGCYVIKSDLSREDADAQTLHDRYRDLEMVERSFRTMKTTHLELRPVFVRKEDSTRGHAFVVMLSLLIQRCLEDCWRELDVTAAEGIDEIGAIHMQEVKLGDATIQDIPKPNRIAAQLLHEANVKLPSVLPGSTVNVHTKKKLPSERKAK